MIRRALCFSLLVPGIVLVYTGFACCAMAYYLEAQRCSPPRF